MKDVTATTKYVLRFSPDYGATSLWPANENARNKYNMPVQYNELPISDKLKIELEKLDEQIFKIINWKFPTEPSLLSPEEFIDISKEGRRLFNSLIEELGLEHDILYDFWI